MADVFFDNPPNLHGQETEQLQQLYAYLNTMSERLNQALMNITIEQMTPETQVIINSGAAEKTDSAIETTKQLIIKTAKVVRTEMDEIRTTLTQEITAQGSEFGELYSQLRNEVTLNANGLQQVFNSVETITDAVGDVQTFKSKLTNYINVGVIDTVGGQDVFGIAIGEHITNPDGSLNLNNKMATFTDEELAFYQNNNKIAYFASNVFHIENGEVTRTMKMGNHTWMILTNNALALVAGSGGGN